MTASSNEAQKRATTKARVRGNSGLSPALPVISIPSIKSETLRSMILSTQPWGPVLRQHHTSRSEDVKILCTGEPSTGQLIVTEVFPLVETRKGQPPTLLSQQ